METGDMLGQGRGEVGALVARLIELAKSQPWPELSKEHRDRIHKKLLETLERERWRAKPRR